MINRINLILRAKNITAKQFAEEIGIQPSGMSHIMGGRNNPSLEFVSKVLRRYPEIDANWLLMGKGEMYSSAVSSAVASVPQSVSSVEIVDSESQSEPSLFDEESAEPMKVEESSHNPFYQQDAKKEEERSYMPSYVASTPDSKTDSVGQIERILLIYSDNTYKELHPQV